MSRNYGWAAEAAYSTWQALLNASNDGYVTREEATEFREDVAEPLLKEFHRSVEFIEDPSAPGKKAVYPDGEPEISTDFEYWSEELDYIEAKNDGFIYHQEVRGFKKCEMSSILTLLMGIMSLL